MEWWIVSAGLANNLRTDFGFAGGRWPLCLFCLIIMLMIITQH